MKKRLRISSKEKLNLINNLATMLEAGIPVFEVVEALLNDASGGQKKILAQLRDDLIAGHHIHTTFGKFPRVFNKVTVNLVKAAEEAGNLETSLMDLHDNIQKEIEFSDKVRSAMIYPVFVMIVFVSVLLAMLVIVIPRISSVFTRLKADLPLPTRALIWSSNALISYWPFIIAGLVALIVTMIILYRQQKEAFLSVLFSLPIISKLVEKIDITRFTRSMFLLLSSGIPFIYALELAEEVVVKKRVSDLISKAREKAAGGEHFSAGLKSKKQIFPNMTIKLIEVGEKTGKLDSAMKNISEHTDYEVSKRLKSLTALLEPIMLVFVGLAVGGMMMAIIAPIYGLIGQVGAR